MWGMFVSLSDMQSFIRVAISLLLMKLQHPLTLHYNVTKWLGQSFDG